MKLNTGNEMPPQLGGKRPKFNIYWVWAAVAVVILSWGLLGSGEVTHPTDWDSVKTMIEQGDVQKIVVVNKETAEVYLKPDKVAEYAGQKDYKGLSAQGPQFAFNIGSLDYFQHNLENTLSERDLSVPLTFETRRNMWSDAFTLIFPILIFFAIWWFLWRGMSRGGGGGSGSGIFNVGKAKAQMFDKDSNVTITFKDVAGLEEAKVEIMEIVDFLKNPDKYRDLGGKIPKGALLVGPPGTGKTLLAKAVAGEANVPFFSISGSDFVEMFVGVGASRVRDLFRQAKEKAPCIVFIDEIDAIGRARSKNAGFSSNDERENTLNQLLTEMDGFGTNAGVIVLAATNRADILDKALLRAGRFDRQINVELPDLKERREIFDVHLKNLKLDPNLDRDFLAKQTPGFSGADIANVCNEAALIAARGNKSQVEKDDFLNAIDRIIGGLERKNKIITPQEKKTIAYHEAGHATVSWVLEHANPLIKVTIIPRGKALGAAWYLPEERQITTKEQMLDEMTPSFVKNELQVEFLHAEHAIFLEADGELLARLFGNLLNNAVKYGKEGKQIRVSMEKEGEYVVTRVINYGRIIPKQELDHIFQKFYRTEQSRSRDTGGTGLGLAIVQQIAELHHGQVRVKSDLQGTVFEVELPVGMPKGKKEDEKR